MSSANTNWEDMYGEVVWAKFGTWWPTYIYDPSKMPSNAPEQIKNTAEKKIGKSYVAFFFGSNEYAFVAKSSVVPYLENRDKYSSSQKMAGKYLKLFPSALEIADQEVVLPKEQRLMWHRDVEDAVDDVEEGDEDLEIEETPKEKRKAEPRIKVINGSIL